MAKSTAKSSIPVSMVRLGDVASLLRLPPGVRDEKIKKGGKKVRVVSIVDLPEAGYISSVPDTISLSKEKYESIKKYRIMPFDVLMSIQGSVGKVGVVPEKFSGDWIANISLLSVRFEEKQADNALALLAYLKSAAGRKVIAKLTKGTTIQRINVKEFASVQVPELTTDIKRQSQSLFGKEITVMEKIDALYDSMEEIRTGYLSDS
jgi:hypothetical protein